MTFREFIAALAGKRQPRKGAGLKRRACCNRRHDSQSCPLVPVELLCFARDGRPIMRYRPEGLDDA